MKDQRVGWLAGVKAGDQIGIGHRAHYGGARLGLVTAVSPNGQITVGSGEEYSAIGEALASRWERLMPVDEAKERARALREYRKLDKMLLSASVSADPSRGSLRLAEAIGHVQAALDVLRA